MLTYLRDREIRNRLLITLGFVVAYRLLVHVPTPGVPLDVVRSLVSSNSLLSLFNVFSGGSFKNFSIVTLGIGPYITASIIFQLFAGTIPALKELMREGSYGQEKINQYTRLLTLPISLFQAFAVYLFFVRQQILTNLSALDLIVMMTTLIVGGYVLVWFGDLITEYGVGNGVSILIFVGIISQLPLGIYQFFSVSATMDVFNILAYVAIALLVIVGVVLVNEGVRNVAITYGRTTSKSSMISNNLPLRINQAGVIPIIFAVPVLLVPTFLAGPLTTSSISWLQDIGLFLQRNFNTNTFAYNALFFILVVTFTFFYTSAQFKPEDVADDIKRRGGFIKGVRPGKATTTYLKNIVNRITLFGGLFLGIVSILPYLFQVALNLSSFSIGGTSLLIVVSVVLETIRQVQTQSVNKNYKGYLD